MRSSLATKSLTAETSSKGKAPAAEYRRIESDLRRRINDGHWSVGTMLPSRRDLAREYTVSPLTIERAITPLITDGTLRADDRRGTFVARGLAAGSPISAMPTTSFSPFDPVATRERNRVIPITIGIIAADYSLHEVWAYANAWEPLLIRSMEQTFAEQEHRTIVYNRVPNDETWHERLIPLSVAFTSLIAERVDAIAVISFDMSPSDVEVDIAAANTTGIPVSCILVGPMIGAVPHVFYDNVRAGYQAGRHLLEQGYRDLTVIAPFTGGWVQERIMGVRQALAEVSDAEVSLCRGASPPSWRINDSPGPLAYTVCQEAIQSGWSPTGGGIIGISDSVALGLKKAAAEVGLKAGGDYGLIGFDDSSEARASRLTSLRPPLESMGREAARLLLQGLRGETGNTQTRLQSQLIPRASTPSSSRAQDPLAPRKSGAQKG